MSLIGFNGLDAIGKEDVQNSFTFNSEYGFHTVSMEAGRQVRSNSLLLSNTGFSHTILGYNLPPGTTKVIQGMDYYLDGALGFGLVFQFIDQDTEYIIFGQPVPATQCSVGIDGDGQVYIAVGGIFLENGVAPSYFVAVSSPVITEYDRWYHIEAEAVIDSIAGYVKVRVNGVEVLSYSGDTQETPNNYVTCCGFGFAALTGLHVLIDNYYVLDGEGPDEIWKNSLAAYHPVVETHVATANVLNEWDPSSDNDLLVNDWQNSWEYDYGENFEGGPYFGLIPERDEYISTIDPVSDLTDIYQVTPFLINSVYNALRWSVVARYDGDPPVVKPVIKQNGTVYDGNSITIDGSGIQIDPTFEQGDWKYYLDTSFELLDPDTSLPWTTAGLRSARYGLKRVAGSGEAYVTQVRVERLCFGPVSPLSTNRYVTLGGGNIGSGSYVG